MVNTHYHGDYSGSNELIQKLGAQVVSSEAARKRLWWTASVWPIERHV